MMVGASVKGFSSTPDTAAYKATNMPKIMNGVYLLFVDIEKWNNALRL
jgi:hypothetical protein